MDDLDFFEGDEAAADHFIEQGQEGVDLFLAVHDFDDERKVLGQAEDFGGMEVAGFAETHGAAQHGCAGEMGFARGEHDGLVKRLVVPAITFADENPEQQGGLGDLHINGLGYVEK